MTLPQMTVAELIERLSRIADKKRPVKIWLPGSRIALAGMMPEPKPGTADPVLIEGNLEPGSALER